MQYMKTLVRFSGVISGENGNIYREYGDANRTESENCGENAFVAVLFLSSVAQVPGKT